MACEGAILLPVFPWQSFCFVMWPLCRLTATFLHTGCLVASHLQHSYAGILLPPPPPLQTPPPCNLPPHPGDRHFHVFLVNMYCAGLCRPSALHLLSNTPRACHAN